jgi:hypothetical protein
MARLVRRKRVGISSRALGVIAVHAVVLASCGTSPNSTGTPDSARGEPVGETNEPTTNATFCRESTEAVEAVTAPEGVTALVAQLRSIDTTGLDETDSRSFEGLVAALADAVDAFESGGSQNGWTTQYVSDFIGRVCGIRPEGGLTVVP